MQIVKSTLKAGSIKRQQIIISIIAQIAIVDEMEQIIHENVE